VGVYSLLFVPSVLYQAMALAAALHFQTRRRRRFVASSFQPPVSVLKPVRGLDPNTSEAFLSQIRQNYPSFEVLFGVSDPEDPAVCEIQRLQAQFPATDIRLVVESAAAANAKVGILIALARQARYPIWVVNDADIRVHQNYLAEVTAPLSDTSIGVVTCAYRAWANSPATNWEALGIATDFMPSVFVAQMIGVRDFALGATLAFRAEDLQAAGGFQSIADYLADDYQLARQIATLGKRTVLSECVVETSLDEGTWSGVWNHQLRWGRTIRTSKGPGYLGLPITHAGVWLLIAVCAHAWVAAALLVFIRLASAWQSATALANRNARRLFWLAPVWDLYAFCVWSASYMGNRVRWRHRTLRVGPGGRLIE
jgi:ceramide glucosyltransferase